MGDLKPITRPSETRQTIKELVAMGCTVDWNTVTGSVRIVPSAAQSGGKPDAFDMVDFGR